MTIRPMKEADLPEVARLSEQLGYPVESLTDQFRILATHPQHQLLVAADDKINGWIHLEKVLDLIEEVKVEIKAFIVDEQSRSQGVGKRLLEEAIIWTRKNGLSTIYLSCNILRRRAHLFYEREGFKKMKTSHFYEVKI